MTSENMTTTIRRKIMKDFLRTLVWIDDEIRPDKVDSLGQPFRAFFYPTAQKFQKEGLLVHLHPYDAGNSGEEGDTFATDSSASFDSAALLANKADIIILDWHLGLNNPKNSIRLLQKLKEEPAVRCIVVLSKFASKFEEEMREGKMIEGRSDASGESHLFRSVGDAWVNDNGTHIIVMEKHRLDEDTDKFGDSVLDNIYKLMAQAHPDYLHWAAVEIAAKLRHFIPEWIQTIPSGADAAVLSELISPETEARTFIPEHLLEDLSHIAKLHMLDSLAKENCQPKDWQNRPNLLADIEATNELESNAHKRFVQLHSDILKISEEDIRKIRESTNCKNCSEFIQSQMQFAQFCETMAKNVKIEPTFGSVYEKLEQQSQETCLRIYVCVSQECDCVRANKLMFLEGKESSPGAAGFGITKLFFQGKEYRFAARAESLMTFKIKRNRSIAELKKVGQLRHATARRILSRFWNHMSRSAVNLPTFARLERDEK